MTARLGYLLKKFPRLSETFVLGEILGQEALGQELLVYSRRPADDEPRHPELAELRAEVVTLPQGSALEPFALLIERAKLDPELLPRLATTLERLKPLGLTRIERLVAEALWLLNDCQQRGLSHLHVHFATDSAIVAHLVAQMGGPSYSITAHAKDIYRQGVDARLLELLIAGSRFTVTVCDANVAHLHGLLSPAARGQLVRLYNGIDQALFAGLERRPVSGRILSIGRLVEKKGFEVLLEACAQLAAQGRTFELVLVGDGEQRANLEARAAQLGLSATTRFTGPLPADRVRAELAQAALFALPCRVGEDGNRDALPTVLLEAQAAGVPAISCPVGGVAEILDQGRAGWLVPEQDPTALAQALARALAEPKALEPLVARGRELGRRAFDRQQQARLLAGLFQRGPTALAGAALAPSGPAIVGAGTAGGAAQ